MQKHTKIYLMYFGYGSDDYIPCEVCSSRAVDIAHIKARSKFGKKRKDEQDVIENLVAMCRKCHYDYDFNNRWTNEELSAIHMCFLNRKRW